MTIIAISMNVAPVKKRKHKIPKARKVKNKNMSFFIWFVKTNEIKPNKKTSANTE
jgi:hypothetical protein